MGEDLVLYKDLGGRFGLLDRHCPHRRADLSYGFVEDTGIRCNYHGWLMDETGRCLEQPYDDTVNPRSRAKERCSTKAYPVKRVRRPAVGLYGAAAGARTAGVGAVHLGERLPRDRALRRAVQLVPVPGELLRPRAFRMDARQLEPAARRQDRSLCRKHLKLKFEEFDYGFIYKRVREDPTSAIRTGPSAASRCGRTASISATTSNGACRSTTRTRCSVAWFFMRVPKGREPYVQDSVPTWVSPIKDENGRWISSHVINQDIIAWVGQGRIADRTKENIGASDLGIAMMRKRLFEELDAVAAGPRPEGGDPQSQRRAVRRTALFPEAGEHRRASRSRSTTSIRCCKRG